MSTPDAPSDPPPRSLGVARGPVSYRDEGPHGTGAPIVAVHGLPGSVRDFRWLAPAVSPDARLVRMDMPGFGATPAATEPRVSVDARARFVIDVVDALGLERPVLAGHSMGGIVAVAAAALAPDRFAALALVSTPGLRAHRPFRRMGRTRWLAHALALPPLARFAEPRLRATFDRGGFRGEYPPGALARTLRCVASTSIRAHATRLRALRLPTLVAWCTDDPLIEADILEEMAAVAPGGPRLRFETGGHNPQKAHAVELGAALVTLAREIRTGR